MTFACARGQQLPEASRIDQYNVLGHVSAGATSTPRSLLALACMALQRAFDMAAACSWKRARPRSFDCWSDLRWYAKRHGRGSGSGALYGAAAAVAEEMPVDNKA